MPFFNFNLILFCFHPVQQKKKKNIRTTCQSALYQQYKITAMLDRRLLQQPSRQTLGTEKYLTQGNCWNNRGPVMTVLSLLVSGSNHIYIQVHVLTLQTIANQSPSCVGWNSKHVIAIKRYVAQSTVTKMYRCVYVCANCARHLHICTPHTYQAVPLYFFLYLQRPSFACIYLVFTETSRGLCRDFLAEDSYKTT